MKFSGRRHRDLFYPWHRDGPLAGGREPCIFTGILFLRIGSGVSPDRRGDISSASRTFPSGHVPPARGLAGSRLLCRIYRATAQTKKLRFERSQLRGTRFARAASLARHTPRRTYSCVIGASRHRCEQNFTSIAMHKALQPLAVAWYDGTFLRATLAAWPLE
jgi:hypothetical protein